MQTQLISENFSIYKFKLINFLKQLHEFTIDVGNKDFQKIVSGLRSNINEPFLFVVVGEVKAGKSSFINALLNADICKVDAAPCTDVVQKIDYSEVETENQLSDNYKRIGVPVEILKSIAIVDTPGTNTVIKHHHEITQNFVPNSDLVLFVFPAKNPHTQSAWDLLDYVNDEWKKNVVFILQQADLARPEELSVNIQKVKEYAIQRGITSPLIFSTSAILELEKKEGSGFEEVRKYIHDTITGGNHLKLKLFSSLDSAEQVIYKTKNSLDQLNATLERDILFVTKIKLRLETGEKHSTFEIKSLVDRLVSNYDKISYEVKDEFEEGLSIVSLFKRTFGAFFNKESSMKNWIEQLQKRFEIKLKSSFEEIADDGAKHFLNGIRQLLQHLIDELDLKEQQRINRDELYLKISEERREVIQDVKSKVTDLLSNDSFTTFLNSNPSNIAPTAMGGGLLTVIGTIILSTTQVAFMDITGGILTGAGLLIAGGVLIFKKSKIIREFKEGLDSGRTKFEQELTQKLNVKLNLIYADINRSFIPFYEYTETEKNRLLPLINNSKTISDSFNKLKNDIENNF
ncbi:MAG: dynamin family protein [Melioribacteraceae bacterium]|nr:dynamin family protein [Melioribacteraceae bacterium]